MILSICIEYMLQYANANALASAAAGQPSAWALCQHCRRCDMAARTRAAAVVVLTGIAAASAAVDKPNIV